MIITRDLYTQVIYDKISSSGISLGQTVIQYEVKAYTDTRNLKSVKSYIVNCTQRLIFPNPQPYIKNNGPVSNFQNYPAFLANNITIEDPGSVMAEISIIDYSPRTLNAAVSTSQNQAQSESSSVSQQYSSGASNSQTNSYSVSGNVGFFGDLLMGGASAGYSYSDSQSQFSSDSRGKSVDHVSQLSNSSSMTVKDWGSYATLDTNNTAPTWVWGQEYPWNVILFKATDESGNVQLPEFIQQRLWDGSVLYPPSELSLFGVDFVAKVSWLLTPDKPLLGNETLSFNHLLTYGAGSHSVSNSRLTANLNVYAPIAVTSQALDLPVLALDPLSGESNKPAIVGFVASKFDVPPSTDGKTFAITSDTNDLLVRGSGFNGVLSSDFSTGPVQMTLWFKVTDTVSDIALHIKHWTENNSAVQLSLVINGNSSTPITRFVDAPETGSGSDNITIIALRNRDLASVDYCDQLQPGLNTVTITATPVASNSKTSWQILALAVG